MNLKYNLTVAKLQYARFRVWLAILLLKIPEIFKSVTIAVVLVWLIGCVFSIGCMIVNDYIGASECQLFYPSRILTYFIPSTGQIIGTVLGYVLATIVYLVSKAPETSWFGRFMKFMDRPVADKYMVVMKYATYVMMALLVITVIFLVYVLTMTNQCK